MDHLTFCGVVHVLCFIIAVVLLVCALAFPSKITRLLEAILATALVAWLCPYFLG